jgi:ActR/RegA family two-component response regulator/predicted regulator of Ras-like GTPase activity (Roadblock/LC7/MglB family)
VTHSILVVDGDRAFATILKEGLEATRNYQVALAHGGEDALESVVERHFDMVIVDMGLSDVKPITLVKAIREAKPAMRLVLIPLFGQQIPAELQALKIQGILPKPFFVGDLPQIVAKAMGTDLPAPATPELKVAVSARHSPPPAREAQPAPAAGRQPPSREEPGPPAAVAPSVETPAYSPETVTRLQAKEPQIVQLLKSLNRELRAEAIIVTLGAHLIASAGLLDRAQSANLAALVAASTEAAARSAAFLGEPDARFEQSLHEGAEYRLYSLSLSEGLVLSLALSSDVPLGTLRYRARQTAEELLELLS